MKPGFPSVEKSSKSRTLRDVRRLCGDDRVDVAVFHLSGCFGWGFKGGFLFSLSSICLTSASQKAQNRSVEDYANNFWLLLSAEQMSRRSLLNHKQLSNRFGVQHLPDWIDILREVSSCCLSCCLSGLDQQVTCFTCFTLTCFSFIWKWSLPNSAGPHFSTFPSLFFFYGKLSNSFPPGIDHVQPGETPAHIPILCIMVRVRSVLQLSASDLTFHQKVD